MGPLPANSPEISTVTSTILNAEGYRLFCKYWEPVGEPKALVFICHGYTEHCLPYDSLATTLATNNFYVFAHDHVGHGQSEGPRATIDSFNRYVDDVFKHTDLIRKKYPALECFICGHSMGGTITILSALRKVDYFKGVILIGPAIMLDPTVATPFKTLLTKIMCWIFPRFPVGKLDVTKITSCPKGIETVKADPLIYHGFTKVQFAATFLKALKEVETKLSSITFPFLICHGEEDRLCIPEGTISMYEKSISEDKSVKIYPKGYHHLLYEPNGIAEQTIEDITDWLNARN